jgi:hypothetical protein
MYTKLSILLISLTFLFSLSAIADDDRDERRHNYNIISSNDLSKEHKSGSSNFGPVENELYKKECGACHMAFQPGLLPARSWIQIMAGLDKHFGDDADIKAEKKENLLAYLTANSMEHSSARKAAKLIRSIGNSTPLRISDIPYLKHEHNEVPEGLIKQKAIRTISNCMACHTTADRGIYSERYIHIPK